MAMRGAGGTQGGVGRFFMGLVMMVAGGYLFLKSIHVDYGFGMGYAIYTLGGVSITGGMVLIPLVFGVGMIFFNARNVVGWILAAGSCIMLFFGIIASIRFNLGRMTAFELLTIIVLLVGGIGLFLSSLRNTGSPDS
jgi:hypothetical protein